MYPAPDAWERPGAQDPPRASTVALADACFHCGEPLAGSKLLANVIGRNEPVCCQGCLAVAELIAGSGLMDYYRFREKAGARPADRQATADPWAAYARPDLAAQFTTSSGETDAVTLGIDGLKCSACSWLIDRVLQGIPGVREASTNASTGRAHVTWDRRHLSLADVMRAIAQLGYGPQPLTEDGISRLQQQERRSALKRLAVAGFGMMQVMMFAVAVYSADLAGEIIDAHLFEFFRTVSLIVATPVMFYAGAPIFIGACNSLRLRTVGMDVPVAIALVLAYAASVWNTLSGTNGEVYFDSVTMFIFFVTLARFIQLSVRYRTTGVSDALARQLPVYAHLLHGDTISDVPVSALQRGDVVLVRTGEIVPADGELIQGESGFDEAMLTGESLPVRRSIGDRVTAGTLNCEHPVHMRVSAAAGATVLSHIVALLRKAQAQKPAISRAADAAAARFLRCVVIGAVITCAAWMIVDPSRAFEATLAVLVVACPCAFAIAMPAALCAATAQLTRHGVLITKPDAIETLARIDRIVFDKTGTLTHGELAVNRCEPLADLTPEQCLQIAAAIELTSEHPLARAFTSYASDLQVTNVRVVPGRGIEADVREPLHDGQHLRPLPRSPREGQGEGTRLRPLPRSPGEGQGGGTRRYRIGTADFVAELRGASQAAPTHQALAGSVILLGDEQRDLAAFELVDVPRQSAPAAITALQALNVFPQILSGDSPSAVAATAERCGIREHFARRSPQQKLAHVQALQRERHCVAMVGDGVNDAPVLAAADVSVAMGRGAALAQASAHMVLVNQTLGCLPDAVAVARRTLRIARQNLIWSAAYNFGSLPLAAFGFIPPWAAALGMSLSSIAVMLNSMRLLPRNESGAATLLSVPTMRPAQARS